jgi:hypothetical protein
MEPPPEFVCPDPVMMTTLHDFLVEHARFPFPVPDESQTVATTDISLLDVSKLCRERKAGAAVRDDTLVQKLCQTLKTILANTPVAADDKDYLLPCFSPSLQVDIRGSERREWAKNPNEAHVRFHLLKRDRTNSHIDPVVVGPRFI